MTRRSPEGSRLRRRLLTRVAPACAAAAVAVGLLAQGGGDAAAGTAPEPTFAALSGTGPTGLRIGPAEPAGTTGGAAAEPSFPATPPEGADNWPVATTIRKVQAGASGISEWIARSSQGGICVLLYDGTAVKGVAAVYSGCSGSNGDARGAGIEVSQIPGMAGETIAAGVVPDGVTSVSEPLADGSTATSTVTDNAWARVADSPAAPGAVPTETRGG